MEKALNGCNLAEPRKIGEKMQEAFMALDNELRHMPQVQRWVRFVFSCISTEIQPRF
jgi:hypothetical protein